MAQQTRRELDKAILKRLDINDEAHERIFKKLDEIFAMLSRMDKMMYRHDKDLYGNGGKGIKDKVEENHTFITAYKNDIKGIDKIQATILKWGGAIVAIAFLASIFLGRLI